LQNCRESDSYSLRTSQNLIWSLVSGSYLIAKHSSFDHSRLNGIIFLVRGGSSHQPIRPWHLPHRSSTLELLILKRSIVFESVNHLLQVQSSVQCNTSNLYATWVNTWCDP